MVCSANLYFDRIASSRLASDVYHHLHRISFWYMSVTNSIVLMSDTELPIPEWRHHPRPPGNSFHPWSCLCSIMEILHGSIYVLHSISIESPWYQTSGNFLDPLWSTVTMLSLFVAIIRIHMFTVSWFGRFICSNLCWCLALCSCRTVQMKIVLYR